MPVYDEMVREMHHGRFLTRGIGGLGLMVKRNGLDQVGGKFPLLHHCAGNLLMIETEDALLRLVQ